MKERLLLISILTIMFTGFISAQFYGDFSSLLFNIDESLIVLGAIFLISFAIINFALSKFFKENRAASGTISFAVSLLIIWGINKTGLDYGSFFYNIFFFVPTGFLETLWPLLLLAVWIFLIVKHRFLKGTGILLLGVGVLLTVLSLTGIIDERGTASAIGIFLAILGVILWGVSKKKATIGRYSSYNRYKPPKSYLYPGIQSNIDPRSKEREAYEKRLKQQRETEDFKELKKEEAQKKQKREESRIKNVKWIKEKGWPGVKKAGKKVLNVGREWTRRDQQMREKIATEKAKKQKAQQEKPSFSVVDKGDK